MAIDTSISLRNQVMYSVYVRNHTEEGTFKALQSDLERIKGLGVDIIWLMPIHPIGQKDKKGSLGCPYSISDYREVNPCYGTKEEFVELVDRIHELGMKCIIDVVYNHTSKDSILSQMHSEFFYHKEDGSFGNHVGDWSDVIDLDYSNRELWNYQIETLKMWAKIVDGFRCDVAPLIPIDFWKQAREACSDVKKDLIWLAESIDIGFIKYIRSMNLNASSDNEIYEAFDMTYDYDIWYFFREYLNGKVTAADYAAVLDMQDGLYPVNYVKIRALENHDQPRIMSYVNDIEVVKRLLAFSFFQKGTAFLYAGEEYGNDKVPNLFEKDVINRSSGYDISEYIQTLSSIKKNSIFADALYDVKAVADSDTFIVKYNRKDSFSVGVFNIKGVVNDVKLDIPDGIYTNAVNAQQINIVNGILKAELINKNNGVVEIIK